jgi:uncharacterized protein YggE
MTSMARKYLFATLAFLAAAAPAVGQVALADDKEPPKRTITMSGKGVVKSAPDKVTVSAGVETQAPTAKDALAKNTAAMTKVVDALKSEGIDPKDIQTTDFSVTPRYEDRDDDRKPPRIVGYDVNNSVYVTMRDRTKIGVVLDQLVQAGANSIGGVYFSVDKPEELEKEARKLAAADAIAKAKLYAEATGAELGAVQTISEQGGYVPYYPAAPKMASASAAERAVPIEPGTQNTNIDVQVTWELK